MTRTAQKGKVKTLQDAPGRFARYLPTFLRAEAVATPLHGTNFAGFAPRAPGRNAIFANPGQIGEALSPIRGSGGRNRGES